MDNPQGRLVAGRYRLLSPLGTGGMGTVWRAQDELLGRGVAVKEVVFPHGLSAPDRDVLRERTRREARAAARLDHPSAVTVFDVVEQDGSPFLVMELVEARTLSQVVRSDGPLTPVATARVGLALLGALEAAHAQGIVHRDVKPGNVLLGPGAGEARRVVLTDFGIASSAGDSSITSTGLLLGSPSYIAPERARGLPPAPASDLWSLGATLFTAVEGRPPYDGGDPLTTVTAVVTGEPAPFERAGPLEEVLTGLLEREPDRRLSIPAARRALQRVVTADDPSRTVALPVPPRASPDSSSDSSNDSPPPAPGPSTDRTTVVPVAQVRAAAVRAAAEGGAAPPVEPPADARPAPRWSDAEQHRSRTPALVALLLVAVSAAVVALVLALDPGGSDDAPAARQPTASASPSATTTTAALPAGWTRYEDPAGWSIGVPPGFVRSTYSGSQVQLRDPEARRTLRIDVRDAGDDPLQALQRLSPQLGAVLAQYEEVGLEPAELGSLPAADLDFSYVDGTDLRVRDRAVLAADGTTYFLYWQVNASDFPDSLQVFEAVQETFVPAG